MAVSGKIYKMIIKTVSWARKCVVRFSSMFVDCANVFIVAVRVSCVVFR